MRTMTLLLAGLVVVGSGEAEAQKKGPEPLPEKVVKAWKDAGAKVGWMGRARKVAYLAFKMDRNELEVARTVPAFRFAPWREGAIVKLPAPDRPFGLYLSDTKATDAGLKNWPQL